MNDRNKTAAAFGWVSAAVYMAVFLFYFFIPYAGALGFNVSPLDIVSSGVNDTATILIVAVFLVTLAAGCLAGAAAIQTGRSQGGRGLFLSAALLGVPILAAHLYLLFSAGDFMGLLAFGFYLNLVLALAASSFAVSAFARSPRAGAAPPVRHAPYAAPPASYGGGPAAAPSRDPGGVIIGKAGMYKHATFPIGNGEELIIGRDAALSHIIVDTGAEKVSRKHCGIVYDGRRRQYIVTDYSSNGTYTEDGARLPGKTMTALPRGVTICLGNRLNSFLLN